MDYQAIIDNLTTDRIKSILEKLDIPYQDKGNCLIMPTYCHNAKGEEASNKLYYYKNNKMFVCYTEDGNMSPFKFLKKYYEAQGVEYDWWNDIYRVLAGDMTPETFTHVKYHSLREKFTGRRQKINLPVYDDCVLGCFVKLYPNEWLKDGISKEAMDKYNILFSISQNKIIIPHYNVNGALCGIRGRALNEWEIENVGKYMPVQIEGVWYKHPLSMNLYGLNFNKDNIKKSGVCYLFESEKSVLQMESFSGDNCAVAVCGSQFNKYALTLLMKYASPREIIICFDREEKEGQDKYFNKLWQICDKYKNYCQFSFCYDRKGISGMKDSPSDNGEAIFKELVESRVKVK